MGMEELRPFANLRGSGAGDGGRGREQVRPPGDRVLYLHGRGDRPPAPPGDLVLGVDWPGSVLAPVLDDGWQAQTFERRVEHVARWLERARLAIGHSFGGWLLLCASLRLREEIGRAHV